MKSKSIKKNKLQQSHCETLKLTQRIIDRRECAPTQKQLTLRDQEVKGFGVKIYPSGKKTYFVRVQAKNKTTDIKLGEAGILDLPSARDLALEHLRKQVKMNLEAQNKIDSITLDDFFENHYLDYAKQHQRSWETTETYYRNHLKNKLGSLRMSDITFEQVLSLQTEKNQAGYADGTCNRIIILLQTLFNRAIRWKIEGVIENPTKNIQLYKINNKKERYLSDAEMQALMDAIAASPSREHLLPIIQILAMTGARKREVLDMRWSDLDLDNKRWTVKINKSGKTQYKPLSDQVIFILSTLKQQKNNVDSEQDWVFVSPKTQRPYSSIFSSWNTARKKAGLHDLRIHDLRHNFASRLVSLGHSLYEVQHLLGHKDPSTTQRYAHLSQERLREAASSIHLPGLNLMTLDQAKIDAAGLNALIQQYKKDAA